MTIYENTFDGRRDAALARFEGEEDLFWAIRADANVVGMKRAQRAIEAAAGKAFVAGDDAAADALRDVARALHDVADAEQRRAESSFTRWQTR